MGLFSSSNSNNTKNKPQQQKKKVVPKTVQQSIPYFHVFENGVIETEPGIFTKSYQLNDVNFKIAPEQEQAEIFQRFGQFLNSFSDNVKFQLIIQNHNTDLHTTLNAVRFDTQRDGLNKYRTEMNNMLLDRIMESKNNLAQDKCIVVQIEDTDSIHAMKVFEGIDKDINTGLRRIERDKDTYPQTLDERLKSLFDIYNQDGQSIYGNVKDDSGHAHLDMNILRKAGMNTKDVIGPSGLEFKPNYFMTGNTYGRVLFLEQVPNWLSTEFLADITNISCSMTVSIHFTPIEMTKAIKLVRDQMINVNAQVSAYQKEAIKNGYGTELIPDNLERARRQTNNLMEDLIQRDQKLYFLTFLVGIFADSRDMLEENTRLLTTVANKYMCPLKTLLYQQEKGLNSILPLCVNQLDLKRLYTTESASVYIPYTSQELYQKNGIYYGLNQTTNNLIVYSRMSGRNYNGIIFGESGSGKSFSAKNEMISVLLRSDKNRVYIIDPESEYRPIAEALNGEIIELSANSKKFVNPLDMDIDYGGDGDPVSMKSDYIISMIEIMLGGGRTLSPTAKSIIDRCVKNIYRGYIQHMDELKASGVDITCDKDAMPTLNNLYEELKRQPEEEAETISKIIEIYAQGSLTTFAHRSNVETSKNLVVYDVSNLGVGMKNLCLHICLNDIWNKMIENRKKGLWTWFYIDEFYLLLQSDSAASFLMQIWKRARKWNGVPTGIMQNTEDLLRSTDARNIINNTSFVLMLALPKLDRVNLSDLLQIPESQLEYITNNEPGTGLIYNGKTIIPFKNIYDRDTMLYKIMSTSSTKDEMKLS